jgi:hypothetical protein
VNGEAVDGGRGDGELEEEMKIEVNELMTQDRSRQGLTLRGIACHIVNAILLWEAGKDDNKYGTRNDCQLVINHLIRHYHDRFEAEKHIVTEYTPQAMEAKENGGRVVKEHAIPVACVMRELIDHQCQASNGDLNALVPQVEAILQASAHRRYVSQDEDRALMEFVDTMPVGHHRYQWADPWVRHDTVGIPFKLKGSMAQQEEAALVGRASAAHLTGKEIADIYETLRRKGGSQESLDKFEKRIRSDYPDVAAIKFGGKHERAMYQLALLSKKLSDRYDLPGNKVKKGVGPGGDTTAGKPYLSGHLSYKNRQNFGAIIAIIQETADSDMVVSVDHYRIRAKEANFREATPFPIDEFEQAAALYETYLDRLGAPRRKV